MDKQAHEAFMRMAIKLSEENLHQKHGGPFGAVIVKDGKLVAASANSVFIENDPTAHAEVSAIRIACKELKTTNLSGCEIYTSCEPCPMCLGAIYWSGISKMYYANTKADAANAVFNDQFIYNEMQLSMETRSLVCVQMLREEALRVFGM